MNAFNNFDMGGSGGSEGPWLQWSARGTLDGEIPAKSFLIRDADGKTKFDGPGSWLAMAAFWSSGSIAPEEMGEVAPDEKLTGQAIASSLMIAAVSGDATQAKPRYRGFLAQAPEVASGKIPLPESKSAAS